MDTNMPPIEDKSVTDSVSVSNRIIEPQDPKVISSQNKLEGSIGHLFREHWRIMIIVGVLLVIIIATDYFRRYSNQGSIGKTQAISHLSTPTPMNQQIKHCSGYFGICIPDLENKWKITVDSLHDFDLVNSEENISLFIMYSSSLSFKDSDPGFTTVSIMNQNKPAYKDVTKDGLTRVLTGVGVNSTTTLLVMLASNIDISAETAQKIISQIKPRGK